jgi:hypothetical protein
LSAWPGRERLHRTRSNYWNEPAKGIIEAFELAGKSQRDKFPQEISLVVHKVGTNRLLSRKTVTFSFSESYDFIPSLLASRGIAASGVAPSLCDEKHESLVWCAREDLNLQSLRNQILSLACLPIPPRAQGLFALDALIRIRRRRTTASFRFGLPAVRGKFLPVRAEKAGLASLRLEIKKLLRIYRGDGAGTPPQ